MKVFITGGGGFIGSHLVEYLIRRGDQVVVLDALLRGNKIPRNMLSKVNLVQGDIRNGDLVSRLTSGCEIVFHLAAILGVDVVADNPMETMEVETLGMKNVVDACILHGVRKLVYASTSGVYGKKAMENAVTEDVEVSPRTSYSIAKRLNEIYLAAALQEKGLQSASARLFNVYGKRQDERMVLPRFVQQAITGQPITVYGTGKQTRDFTYVEDVVHALALLAEKSEGSEIINIAKGEDITIESVAKIVKEFFAGSSPITYIKAPKARYDFEVERRYGNSDKLHKTTGYKPETSFRDGFVRTYDDFRTNVGDEQMASVVDSRIVFR